MLKVFLYHGRKRKDENVRGVAEFIQLVGS